MEGGPKVMSLSWLPLLFLAQDFLVYYNRETKIHHNTKLCTYMSFLKLVPYLIRFVNGDRPPLALLCAVVV